MSYVEPHQRVGTVIGGRYRLDRVLGKGGMGVVLAGTHELTGRRVAIKLLLPQFAKEPEILARFFQEAQSAAGINHPNVVDTLDMGVEDEQPFLVLELLDGEDLAHRLAEGGPIPETALLPLVLPVVDALAAAHEHGIVHRDLKPENIFISTDARGRPLPKVLDFGIAKLVEGESAVKTRAGGVIGTPTYMSPEQARGTGNIGPPSDVWSMGVVLYECLGGRVPFTADTLTGVLMKICTEEPRPLPEVAPFVHPAIAAVVNDAMQRTVDDRIQTMTELGRRLTQAAAAAQIELPPAVTGLFDPAAANVSTTTTEDHPPAGGPAARTRVLTEGANAFAPTMVGQEAPTVVDDPSPRGGRAGWVVAGIVATLAVAGGITLWLAGPWGSAPSQEPGTRAAIVETSAEGPGEVELAPPPTGGGTGPTVAGREAAQPEAAQPDVTEPEAAQPDVTEPEAAQPDVPEPEAAQPDVPEPEAAEEGVAEAPPREEAVASRASRRRSARRGRRPSAARRSSRTRVPTAPSPTPSPAPSPEGRSAEERTPTDTRRGQIFVLTNRGWAVVYLGGRRLGRTPLRTYVPVGRHRLRILPQGREPALYANVNVEWGGVANVVLRLGGSNPRPPPSSLEEAATGSVD